MGYPQASTANPLSRHSIPDAPPPPQETVQQVLDQTQDKMAMIETQVDEIIGRLFNFPRGSATDAKSSQVPSVSERMMDLRSRAIRINEALATVLEKL